MRHALQESLPCDFTQLGHEGRELPWQRGLNSCSYRQLPHGVCHPDEKAAELAVIAFSCLTLPSWPKKAHEQSRCTAHAQFVFPFDHKFLAQCTFFRLQFFIRTSQGTGTNLNAMGEGGETKQGHEKLKVSVKSVHPLELRSCSRSTN